MKSLALTPEPGWDLFADAAGNIAAVSASDAVLQDVECALKTFLADLYYAQQVGLPYLQQIMGQRFNPAILGSLLEQAALAVPGVVQARAALTLDGRTVTGTVSIVDTFGQALLAHL